MNNLIKRYEHVCRLISGLLPGQIEVILHDLKSDTIVAIEGGFSNRKLGDSSLIDVEGLGEENSINGIIGPYPHTNWDGEVLKSFSIKLHDDDGTPLGLMCVNCKTSALSKALETLSAFVEINETRKPGSLFSKDWRDLINQIVASCLSDGGTSMIAANRRLKVAMLSKIDDSGLLEYRGSSDYVANVLGVSRASFYNLLRDARKDKHSQTQGPKDSVSKADINEATP